MKSKIFLPAALILICAFYFYASASAQTSASDNFSGLEGKTFRVQIVNKVKTTDKKTDLLTFSQTDFKSELCCNEDMHIISKNIYLANGAKYFSLEFKCERNKKVIWEGEIQNNKLSGTLTCTVGNKSPVVYLFSGEIAQ